MVPDQLRADFPEFADVTRWADSQLSYWLGLGTLLLNPCRWGSSNGYLRWDATVTYAKGTIVLKSSKYYVSSQDGNINHDPEATASAYWAAGYPVPNLLDTGTELFAAHHLVLDAQAVRAGAAGGEPGLSRGVISSEGADAGSVSYDTSGGIQADAGHWNLTVYGNRLARLFRTVGAGPLYIGAGGCAGVSAWPGPPFVPGW